MLLRGSQALEKLDIEVRRRECWDARDHGDDSDSSDSSDGGDSDGESGVNCANNPAFVTAVAGTNEAFASMV
jgi:hypothetical protein